MDLLRARAARLLCICAPAGQEDFFLQLGISVASRTSVAPKLDEVAQATSIAKAIVLAPRYGTEFLQP